MKTTTKLQGLGDQANFIVISLYIDDLLVTGSNVELIQQFKDDMMQVFEMTDLGEMSYFLGMEVKQIEGDIFISQRKYAKYKNLGGEIMKMKHTCFCYVHFLLRSGLQYIDCLVYVWCSIIRYIYSHYIQHGLFFTGQKLKAFTRCYLARWLLVYMAT